MRRTVELTYGNDKLALQIPNEFLAGEVVRPKPSKRKLTEPEMIETIDRALSRPVGRPRLSEWVGGKSVAILISDEFRAGLQRLILDRLLREVHSGGAKRIGVFVATGSHDPLYYAKNTIQWFHESCRTHGVSAEIFANDCDAPHVRLGSTPNGSPVEVMPELLDFDLRVYGHEAKHHYMNGYSILDKQLSPGLASRRTIEATHKMALDSEHSLAGRNPWHAVPERQFNPFGRENRDVRLWSERFRRVNGAVVEQPVEIFALEMISTKNSIDWIFAGDPEEAARQVTHAADEAAAFLLPPTRYVAISPGGPPACNALYGVQNCFDMALKGAIRDGGEALVVAPCVGRPDLPPDVRGIAPDAKSKVLFWDNLCRYMKMPLPEVLSDIDRNFELYLWKTDRMVKLLRVNNIKVHLYSTLPGELLSAGGIIPVSDPQAWIDERAARGDGQIRVIDDGNKMLVLPES